MSELKIQFPGVFRKAYISGKITSFLKFLSKNFDFELLQYFDVHCIKFIDFHWFPNPLNAMNPLSANQISLSNDLMTISCNQNPLIEINYTIHSKMFLFLNIFRFFVRISMIDDHFGFDKFKNKLIKETLWCFTN